MKKTVLIIAAVLGLAVAASAQPKAIGARFGYGLEASYQHWLGNNFIEADLGLSKFDGFFIAGMYDFMIARPNWTDRGEWGFYPGLGLGYVSQRVRDEASGEFKWKSVPFVGVVGQVGLEYTFWFPLQLSVDLRPGLGLLGDRFGFYDVSVFPSVSARYAF